MYEFKSRVRYSETGSDRKLSLTSLIDYLQDSSTFHSESIGLGIDYLEKNKMAWMLVSWQIIVYRYPELGENITVKTWPYGFRSFYADRNFVVYGDNDELLACANSLWLLINLETGHPMKAREEQVVKYLPEPKFDMPYAPRKISLPEEFKEHPEIPVYKHMIDTNGHMNNGQYVLIAKECIPEDFTVHQVRTEYKKGALLGDIVVPRSSECDGRYVIKLEDTEGSVFAVVEFS